MSWDESSCSGGDWRGGVAGGGDWLGDVASRGDEGSRVEGSGVDGRVREKVSNIDLSNLEVLESGERGGGENRSCRLGNITNDGSNTEIEMGYSAQFFRNEMSNSTYVLLLARFMTTTCLPQSGESCPSEVSQRVVGRPKTRSESLEFAEYRQRCNDRASERLTPAEPCKRRSLQRCTRERNTPIQ